MLSKSELNFLSGEKKERSLSFRPVGRNYDFSEKEERSWKTFQRNQSNERKVNMIKISFMKNKTKTFLKSENGSFCFVSFFWFDL